MHPLTRIQQFVVELIFVNNPFLFPILDDQLVSTNIRDTEDAFSGAVEVQPQRDWILRDMILHSFIRRIAYTSGHKK
jgi:hypothetical protein